MATRKTFSPETKAEALQLLSDGYTLKQTADHIGCNVNSIQNWKAAAKSGKRRSKKIKRAKVRKKAARAARAAVHHASFAEFVQNYWRQNRDAGDVLQLPPDIAPKAVQYVNNVLRYAYDQLGGE